MWLEEFMRRVCGLKSFQINVSVKSVVDDRVVKKDMQ